MSRNRDIGRVHTVAAKVIYGYEQRTEPVSFVNPITIGNGSFGVVLGVQLLSTGETVAIKKVAQDRRYRNRELDIMLKLNHPNIVTLKFFYYTGEEKDRFLCLGLEYVPSTLYALLNKCNKEKRLVPSLWIKLYSYQLFRSLAYLHSIGICHRDIKPANLLINTETGVLKLCDFGCAKCLVEGETNVSYICSRYYRAPELLFNSTDYTPMIDVWSAGCILAELILGLPIFLGDSQVDQLAKIIGVLGTPSKGEMMHLNKAYAEYSYPHLDPKPWQEVFKNRPLSADALDLITRLLVYTPSARISPLQACAHKFFNKLREPGMKLINGRKLPPLFNFSEHELKIQPNLNSVLIPPHLKDNYRSSTDSVPVTSEASSSVSKNNLVISENQSKKSITL